MIDKPTKYFTRDDAARKVFDASMSPDFMTMEEWLDCSSHFTYEDWVDELILYGFVNEDDEVVIVLDTHHLP